MRSLPLRSCVPSYRAFVTPVKPILGVNLTNLFGKSDVVQRGNNRAASQDINIDVCPSSIPLHSRVSTPEPRSPPPTKLTIPSPISQLPSPKAPEENIEEDKAKLRSMSIPPEDRIEHRIRTLFFIVVVVILVAGHVVRNRGLIS